MHRLCRAERGIDLSETGHALTVVFSGGTLKDAGIACSSAQLSLEAAEHLGVPPQAAVIADGARSTYDEAVNLRALARERGWESLIVVTHVYHTRRAGRTFPTLIPEVAITVSGPPDPRFGPARWWQTEEGLTSVFTEWIKLGFYWVNYGISPF